MDIKLISQRITQLCKERGWSYYRLAKEAGFQQATLFPILHEKNMPNLYTLNDICNALGITLSEFFHCDLFEVINNTDNYIELWEQLNNGEKEKVLIYMCGLLHKNFPFKGGE